MSIFYEELEEERLRLVLRAEDLTPSDYMHVNWYNRLEIRRAMTQQFGKVKEDES